jgi:hypothetical protein
VVGTELGTDAPVGRHSRDAGPRQTPVVRTPSGRHAAGRRSAPAASVAPLADLDIDLDDDITPDDVEEIADEMLTHLAASEPRPPVIHFDELPGGKWGVMAGGALALILVLMIASVVLSLVFNR